ncbi:MAG: PKD domain-containing protein [Methanoregula sp.]|uniref:PKD domain-containing protein n=1 Tax=Methanoregula sp. TaxID=2052170 RepID=UPI003C5695A2
MSLSLFAIVLAGVLIFSAVYAENTTPDTTPFITIDPVGNHTIDEVFFINGTTNLPANNEPLLLQIETTNFNPGGAGSFFSSNVSIQLGENGVNSWSCNATTSLWETFGPGPQQVPLPDAEPGQYIVDVITFGPSGATALGQLFFILPSGSPPALPPTVPVAAFGYYGNRTTEPYNMVPLAVQFEDTSTNSPTAWLWTFGDGSTSSSHNPTHIYTSAGTYTVTLTATNAAGSNTTPEPGIITVSGVATSPPITIQETPSHVASTVDTNITSPTRQDTPLPVIVPVIAIFAVIVCWTVFHPGKRA